MMLSARVQYWVCAASPVGVVPEGPVVTDGPTQGSPAEMPFSLLWSAGPGLPCLFVAS